MLPDLAKQILDRSAPEIIIKPGAVDRLLVKSKEIYPELSDAQAFASYVLGPKTISDMSITGAKNDNNE